MALAIGNLLDTEGAKHLIQSDFFTPILSIKTRFSPILKKSTGQQVNRSTSDRI